MGNKALGQAQDDINDFFQKIYGGKCAAAAALITGDQCLSPISVCDTNQGLTGLGVEGECRPVWWSLAGHWPRCPLPSWRVPVLLHLLLLLGNPRLPLLLLQGEQGLLPCRNWLNLHSLQNDHLANI